MDIADADLAAHAKVTSAAMPPEILLCRCVAATVIIPLFIPALHKRLRSLLRPGVRAAQHAPSDQHVSCVDMWTSLGSGTCPQHLQHMLFMARPVQIRL